MFRKQLTAALVLTLALTGCDSGPAGSARPGTFSLHLTDAPGDLARAVVTIERIYLQGSSDGDPESERVSLMETPVTVNLLELRNEAMALVEGVTVPGGTYGQLRMVISGGFIEVIEAEDDDGVPTQTRIYASSPQYAAEQGVSAQGSLQMPSFAQSGLKIRLPGGAAQVDGDQHILLLDFNVAQSFGQQAGASGMWVMNPVVTATDFTTTGGTQFTLALAEGVTLPEVDGEAVTLEDFQVTLDRDGDLITENFVAAQGTHRVTFRFLEPRDAGYPVSLVVPEGITVTVAPAFPAEVTVTGSGTTVHSFTITAASLDG
jgi:hypothetical protein